VGTNRHAPVNQGDNKYLYARIAASATRAARFGRAARGGGGAESAVDEDAEFTLEELIWRIEKLAARNNDDIQRRLRFAVPKQFTGQPFGPVPDDGAADFTGSGDAETRVRSAVGARKDRHQATADLGTITVRRFEIGAPGNVFGRAKRLRCCGNRHVSTLQSDISSGPADRSGRALALVGHGQTLAPLGAAPLEDLLSILGFHADQETMRLLATAIVWLKRANTLGHC
jgi:hypothetical protein